jgi:hypothetical protein
MISFLDRVLRGAASSFLQLLATRRTPKLYLPQSPLTAGTAIALDRLRGNQQPQNMLVLERSASAAVTSCLGFRSHKFLYQYGLVVRFSSS